MSGILNSHYFVVSCKQKDLLTLYFTSMSRISSGFTFCQCTAPLYNVNLQLLYFFAWSRQGNRGEQRRIASF